MRSKPRARAFFLRFLTTLLISSYNHIFQIMFVSQSRRNLWQRLGYDGIRKVMDAISKQTGINFHAHQFRHTFATNLVIKGMNPYHVMTLTRHKSVQNFRRYTKAADQQAAEKAFHQITETSQRNVREEAGLNDPVQNLDYKLLNIKYQNEE